MSKRLVTNSRIETLLESGRLKEAFEEPLDDRSPGDGLQALLFGRTRTADVAFAGLTLGDLVYDLTRIDPLIVQAVDFSRSADLSGLLDFAAYAVGHASLAEVAREGSLSQIQGYVAERIAALHLSAAGHDVSFPSSASQPGWDLLVDGQPFQVKCALSAQTVREHFERFPEIPVLVNVELGAQLAGHPGVYTDAALSAVEVRAITEDALSRGVEVTDFELPWIAVAVGGAVELRDIVFRGVGTRSKQLQNQLPDC